VTKINKGFQIETNEDDTIAVKENDNLIQIEVNFVSNDEEYEGESISLTRGEANILADLLKELSEPKDSPANA
jgi:hypothetical protein